MAKTKTEKGVRVDRRVARTRKAILAAFEKLLEVQNRLHLKWPWREPYEWARGVRQRAAGRACLPNGCGLPVRQGA